MSIQIPLDVDISEQVRAGNLTLEQGMGAQVLRNSEDVKKKVLSSEKPPTQLPSCIEIVSRT